MITTYTIADVQVCAVQGRASLYVIDPYRDLIGITRAQMVDRHLDDLVRAGLAEHPDAAVLVEARATFRAAEQVTA